VIEALADIHIPFDIPRMDPENTGRWSQPQTASCYFVRLTTQKIATYNAHLASL